MNNPQQTFLYPLLPAIYRQRDAAQGEPLQALLAVIEQEYQRLTDGIAGLYDNWFIETCDEWAAPYIGDLLGVRGLSSETRALFSQRNYVANALHYRRRKGVLAVLAHVAQDLSGWSVYAVEYFRLLGLTQHLHFPYPLQGATVDLRDQSAMTWLDTPFERTAHQVDVRTIADNRGKHNLGQIGLFVWRLPGYPLTGVPAYQVQEGCFTFHPAGLDQPLFARPQPPLAADAAPTLDNLPLPLSQAALALDLAQRDKAAAVSRFYGAGQSFWIDTDTGPITAQQLVSTTLAQWASPAEKQVAVDVVRGRIAFGAGINPKSVTVDYSYGFAANLGGGPYDRRHTLAAPAADTWQMAVQQSATNHDVATPLLDSALGNALLAWEAYAADQEQPHGIITITDNGVYALPAVMTVDKGNLVIQAADSVRPVLRTVAPLAPARPRSKRRTTARARPADLPNAEATPIDAGLRIEGMGAGALTFNGLLLSTPALVLAGSVQLLLTHTTLLPPAGDPASARPLPSISAADGAAQLRITDSRVGPLRLAESLVGLTVEDSIIDGGASDAIAGVDKNAFGPATSLERVTIFGAVTVRELSASEVIFTGRVQVQRRQSGLVRFSYLPDGSQTPQRYRCQPDLAQAGGATTQFLQPSFTATDYRDPAYAQLGPACPREIAAGAENGAEMGVFHHLLQPQRSANLRTALDESLPAGLEAGIYYIT